MNTLWDAVKQHLYNLITGAIEHNHMFLLERTVVGLMRLASRLMRREEISSMVKYILYLLFLNFVLLICYFVFVHCIL